MKKIKLGLWLVLLAAVCSTNLFAASPELSIADHLQLANTYEEKAAKLNADIAVHEKMKLEYADRFYVDDEKTPIEVLKKMEIHCDRILTELKNLQAQHWSLARFHRDEAHEIEEMDRWEEILEG